MALNHLHGGHRARLRARFQKSPDSLEDHELLELLLFYAIPQKDTNALAHALLHRFGSFSNVINAAPDQIREVPGMGETSSQMFSVMAEAFRRYLREQVVRVKRTVYDPAAVGSLYLSRFFGITQEHVIAIALDQDFSVQGEIELGTGDFFSAPVNTTKLSRFIGRMHPYYVVIAHNHPSGVALPSPEDFKTTDMVRAFVRSCGSCLIDHLIFDGRGDFVSLGVSGQMDDNANRYYYQVTQVPFDTPGEIRFSFRKMPLVAEIMTKNQTSEK